MGKQREVGLGRVLLACEEGREGREVDESLATRRKGEERACLPYKVNLEEEEGRKEEYLCMYCCILLAQKSKGREKGRAGERKTKRRGSRPRSSRVQLDLRFLARHHQKNAGSREAGGVEWRHWLL